jgi:hypothetical protein
LRRRLDWPFWNWRFTPDGARQKKPLALLGDARLAAIIANVALPLIAAEGPFPDELARCLPTEDLSAPMREAANALFGRDHNPALYASRGLYQQGLLRIQREFCLNARAGCAQCALAEALRR